MISGRKFLFINALLVGFLNIYSLTGFANDAAANEKYAADMAAQLKSNNYVIAIDKASTPISKQQFECFKNLGITNYIGGYNDFAVPTLNTLLTNFENAQALGFSIGSYYKPQNYDFDAQDVALFNALMDKYNARMVALDFDLVGGSPSKLNAYLDSWYKAVCESPTRTATGHIKACNLYVSAPLTDLLSNASDQGVAPLEKFSLWYANWNAQPDLSIDPGLAPWKKAGGVQFKNLRLCGTEVDLNAFTIEAFPEKPEGCCG